MKKTKPPLRQVVADDLTVVVDEKTYHPHAGESVWIRPGGVNMGLMKVWTRMAQLQSDPQNLSPDEGAELASLMSEACNHIPRVIARWDWTDDEGEPMPPLTPESAMQLHIEELMWLFTVVVMGRTGADAKNAEEPSTAS